MIEALPVVVALVAADAGVQAVTAGQVAAKHKYGMATGGWPAKSKALQLSLAPGGPPGRGWQEMRIEARCYGESQVDAGKVYAALAAMLPVRRSIVSAAAGNVLVYFVGMDSTPGTYRDPDVGVDFMLCYLKAAVSEETV